MEGTHVDLSVAVSDGAVETLELVLVLRGRLIGLNAKINRGNREIFKKYINNKADKSFKNHEE